MLHDSTLYTVPNETKLVHGVRSHNSGGSWQGLMTGWAFRAFGSSGNAHFLDLRTDCPGGSLCENSLRCTHRTFLYV